jgi:hypothetical protein
MLEVLDLKNVWNCTGIRYNRFLIEFQSPSLHMLLAHSFSSAVDRIVLVRYACVIRLLRHRESTKEEIQIPCRIYMRIEAYIHYDLVISAPAGRVI